MGLGRRTKQQPFNSQIVVTSNTLSAHLEKLSQLTFTRQKLCAPLIEQIHHLLAMSLDASDRKRLLTVLEWLLCPYTLWPIDMKGAGERMCMELCEIKKLSDEIRFILDLLHDLPSQEAQEIVARNERTVKEGDYEEFLTPRAQKKYAAAQKKMLANQQFKEQWSSLKKRFNFPEVTKPGTIHRRLMTCERNFRVREFENQLATPKQQVQAAIDSVCWLHSLYGVLDDSPLLQKLSVNPTPFGIIIFIPTWWPFDMKRDLKSGAIKRLQKASRLTRLREVEYELWLEKVLAAMNEADKLGLAGDAKHVHICKALGVPIDTDDGTVRRWVRHTKRLQASAKW